MRILVIDEEFPYPLNTGKRTRSFNLLKRIASRHELRYLAYGSEDSENFRALRNSNMNPIAVLPQVPRKSGIAFYFKLMMNLFSKNPYIVTSHYSLLFQDTFNKQLKDFMPSLIISEWTPYASYVKEIEDATKVIVAHNIESNIWWRYYQNEKQPIKRWYIKKQWNKVVQFEKMAFSWVDGATAVSKVEAEELMKSNRRLRVEVIDNGVDLDYFHAGISSNVKRQLVFTGAMDWRPNQDAVVFFINNIFPLLKKSEPDLVVIFVGRNPSSHISGLGERDGVTVTGTVDDVRPYIEKAAVYIVPLRIGGGSRLKILEALAMKKAVVSTTIGAEGLDVTDGQDILIADTPDQFASRILQVLSNEKLAEQLGKAGRRLVEAKYGWDFLADRLEKFLIKLVEAK